MTMRILTRRTHTGVRVGWAVLASSWVDWCVVAFVDLGALRVAEGRLSVQVSAVGGVPAMSVGLTDRRSYIAVGVGARTAADVWRCGPLYVARGVVVT